MAPVSCSRLFRLLCDDFAVSRRNEKRHNRKWLLNIWFQRHDHETGSTLEKYPPNTERAPMTWLGSCFQSFYVLRFKKRVISWHSRNRQQHHWTVTTNTLQEKENRRSLVNDQLKRSRVSGLRIRSPFSEWCAPTCFIKWWPLARAECEMTCKNEDRTELKIKVKLLKNTLHPPLCTCADRLQLKQLLLCSLCYVGKTGSCMSVMV